MMDRCVPDSVPEVGCFFLFSREVQCTHGADRSGMIMQASDGSKDGDSTPSAVATDAVDMSNAISNKLKAYDEDTEDKPSSQELLGLLHQQSKLMLKYQSSLDQTNAKLMSQQKLLLQLADTVQVRKTNEVHALITYRPEIPCC